MPSMVSTGAGQSFVSVSKTVMDADGVDSCGVFINVYDGTGFDGEPIAGISAANIVVSVSGTGNTVTQPTGVSDIDGSVSGASFVTTVAEDKTVTVTVAGVALTQQPVVDAGGSITPPAPGAPFFTDDFAGPAFNSANGFTWGAPNDTAAVTFDGAGAIRFRYGAGGGSAEQRFDMGRDLTEVWLEYDLHVPANFAHANTSPNNNKFLQMWRTTYSDVAGGTWRCGIEYQTNGTVAPNSNIRFMSSRWDSNSNDSSGMGMPDNFAPFIGTGGPVAIDAWSQIRIHIKKSTDRTTSDGVFQLWVDGVLEWSQTDGKFNNAFETPADCFLRNGYLMGSANAAFVEQTDFHVRAFKAYDADPGWVV